VLSRRLFLALTGAGTLGLFLRGPGGSQLVHAEALPGGTLEPTHVPKFVTPLLIPPVMPRAGAFRERGGKNGDYYEISVKQFRQQILPAGLPATTVWGYGADTAGRRGLRLHNAPSLTIEAQWNRPVRVKWTNDLVDANGDFRPHLLPVDPTLHWANPPGGTDGRDTRPMFDKTPTSYTGPVPIVTHVHGAVGVHDDSDGYAEAWYLPAAGNIPADYATQGTWYEFFAGKAAGNYNVTWDPGSATFQYPNTQRASTLWYHDHTLGMTRLNVYAGPAGFFLIRGGPSGDSSVLDSRTGGPAVLPGPAPKEGDRFPSNKVYYELPIVIQDRTFNKDGSLFYPDTRAFFDGYEGPYLPESDLSPIWNPEFFGNTMMVNGNTWPYLAVEQRRYRFRFLNGCDSRFLMLDFNQIPGVEVWQIGNEGGFLAAPVNLTADHENALLMALAERADVIVDFTNVPRGNYVLGNLGPDEPFGGGEPDEDFDVADPGTTGQVMEFRVGPSRAPDPTTPPTFLQLPAIVPLPEETTTRPLALLEMMAMDWDGPAAAMLGTVDADGNATARMWSEAVTENPAVGDVEVWEFFNGTADAHPMHIHEVVFEVVNRQHLAADEEGIATQPFQLDGDVMPPEPWESGFKDTVIAYPGQVTRVRMRFANAGQFTWHCHIVSHEDNEMMRPYRIGLEQDGQPMPHHHPGM
jgi:spore coat protein A